MAINTTLTKEGFKKFEPGDWEKQLTGEHTTEALLEALLPGLKLPLIFGILGRSRGGLKLIPKKAWVKVFGPKVGKEVANYFKKGVIPKSLDRGVLKPASLSKRPIFKGKLPKTTGPLETYATKISEAIAKTNKDIYGKVPKQAWDFAKDRGRNLPAVVPPTTIRETARMMKPIGEDFNLLDLLVGGGAAGIAGLYQGGKFIESPTGKHWQQKALETLIPDPDMDSRDVLRLKRDMPHGALISRKSSISPPLPELQPMQLPSDYYEGETEISPEDEMIHDLYKMSKSKRDIKRYEKLKENYPGLIK
jgi:hypothetical protein